MSTSPSLKQLFRNQQSRKRPRQPSSSAASSGSQIGAEPDKIQPADQKLASTFVLKPTKPTSKQQKIVEKKNATVIEKRGPSVGMATVKKVALTDAPSAKKARSIHKKKLSSTFNATTTLTTTATTTDKSTRVEEPILSKSLVAAQKKLAGAQFRWLNEQLYSTPSSAAVELFAEDPALFDVYHEGFRHQVESWPVHPLDLIIEELRATKGPRVVGDFGCGEARLARTLLASGRFTVHSFDLVAPNELVTAADIKRVPLPDACLDVAVFCLALMGTNVADFLLEAFRTLKPGGLLIIAEVRSRFDSCPPERFSRLVESLGFRSLSHKLPSKMFNMFHFRKTDSPKPLPSNLSIPLKACQYKKR